MSNHDQLLKELRVRIANEEPLPGENYFQEDETLLRFLKAREWNLEAAEKQLREAIAWRRSYQPLTADCRWCHQQPGCHSMRQVGFDESGRPVIYSCFAQANANSNGVEESIAHCTYLIENAKRTMRPGVTTWIFVIDCTGISLPACNPRLGYSVTQVFSNFYPERLGKVFCVNHSGLFHGVWCAIQRFLHPATAAKMKMLRGKSKIRDAFDAWFPADLAAWLLEEMRRNRSRKHLARQRQFWRGSAPGEEPDDHDPRGCAEYVAKYIEAKHPSGHQPHPNIVAYREGRLQLTAVASSVPTLASSASAASLQSSASGSAAADAEDDDQPDVNGAAEAVAALEIPEEFAIPEGAQVMSN